MKYLLVLTLLLLSLGCFAAIYMQTDKNGNVIYSDTSDSNTKPITVPNANNISLPQNTVPSATNPEQTATAAGATADQQQPSNKSYSVFTMLSPTDQQTFQNQQDIPITLKIEPALQEGDKVQLYLDDKPTGDPSTDLSQLAIHQAVRGEHQLSAALEDSTGQILKKTDDITIFIHYSAIPTGSGAISAVPSGGGAPSSPGTGIVPSGSGVVPAGPITPVGSGSTPPGSGIMPPAQGGGGLVPGRNP